VGDVVAVRDGSVWLTVPDADLIVHLPCTGPATTFDKTTDGSQLEHPFAITRAADGGAWFTEGVPLGEPGRSGNRLCHVTPDEEITCEPIPGQEAGAVDIATMAGTDGIVPWKNEVVWFTEQGSDRIWRRSHDRVRSFRLGGSSRPERIVVAPDGSPWFTEPGAGTGTVGTLDPDGQHGRTVDVPGTGPRDLAVTGAGGAEQVWVTTGKGIARLDPHPSDTRVTPVPLDGSDRRDLERLAVDVSGNRLWFTERGTTALSPAWISSLDIGADRQEPPTALAGVPGAITVAENGTVWLVQGRTVLTAPVD
jgi:streptogramin lyase